jgi:tRNA-dihydrouridine synthase B
VVCQTFRAGEAIQAPHDHDHVTAAIAEFLVWRQPFCDDGGELLPKYTPAPMIASFMRDPDDPASVTRDTIPVPKGPVEVW